ncbi:MAG: tetratricopeptide repeat protein [Chloroflexota bacterium]
MFRVTSLAEMPDAQLNRWIKRIALLFVVLLIAFVAFYAVDRFRMPTAPLVNREMAAMEEAVRADPTDIVARGRLADVYLAAERYEDAVIQLSEIIKTGKQDEAAYVRRGRAYELMGNLDAAAADYAKVIEVATNAEMAGVDAMLEMAYYGLGSIALQQDRADDAIGYLLDALAIKRTDADAMNLLGAAYVQAGTPEKAFEPLRQAILFVPTGWPEPYQALADAYTATGETEQAEWAAAMAAAMTALAPGGSGDIAGPAARLEAIAEGKAGLDARIGLGLLAETSGDTGRAADWYRKALELDPQSKAAQLGLSRVADGTQVHPDVVPSASPEGSN